MENIELPGGLGQHLGKIPPEAPIPTNIPLSIKSVYLAVRKPGEHLVLAANITPSYSQLFSVFLLCLCGVINCILASYFFPNPHVQRLINIICLILFFTPAAYTYWRVSMFTKATIFITTERCLIFGYKLRPFLTFDSLRMSKYSAVFPSLNRVKVMGKRNNRTNLVKLRLGGSEIALSDPIADEDLQALKKAIDNSVSKQLEGQNDL